MIGFALGLVAGASTGTAIGAFFGAMIGMTIGLTIHGYSWARVRLGDAPVVETHRVMCTSFGQAAKAEYVGDLERGRFYDVKRCSLIEGKVDCEKGCLRQIRLAGVKPGEPCNCGH